MIHEYMYVCIYNMQFVYLIKHIINIIKEFDLVYIYILLLIIIFNEISPKLNYEVRFIIYYYYFFNVFILDAFPEL